MARFFYSARDSLSNKREQGFEEASTQEEAISRLQARGLLVLSISAQGPEAPHAASPEQIISAKSKPKHSRITSDDLVLFCRQLATLLGAGVTILKSMDIISQQVASKRLYKTIQDLQKDMEAGLSLHEAMAHHPKIFSELWVNLAESGEASGNLALVLNRLAGYLERNAAFKTRLISALIYPTIVMFVGIGALLFLTIKIIPTFAELFSSFKIELPLLTKMMMSVSYFIRKYALPIAGFSLAAGIALKKYIGTAKGRRNFEKFIYSLPVFGDFFRALAVERFTSEMATLIESGVPILYALEITEHSVGSVILGDIIRNIKDNVRDGKPLGQSLERSGFFEPMVVQMVAIGEEIGELFNMFKRLNAAYEEQINTLLARFTSMFEPLMLVFMGLIIGLMVVGMFLPIFKLTSAQF
jgi:type IV pilus assembly protein PilC